MSVYIVERDLPMATVERLHADHIAIARASLQLAARGQHVTHTRCLFVPQEARTVCLFESPTAELVRDVNEEAGVPFVRIVPAIDVSLPKGHGDWVRR
jgi:hypothetical protein